MVNAKRDDNFATAKLAVLNTDTVQGTNLVRIVCNENNFNGIKTNAVDTISFTMQPIDPRDENYVGCWTFTGSDGQLYPCVATAAGELLVDF